jgi:RND superfamily putative drug exporter
MSTGQLVDRHTKPSLLARMIRRSPFLVILGWLALTVAVSIGVPPLEQVAKAHAVSMSPKDAPSVQAMKRMGELFKESDSDSVAMIVLEGDHPLGDDAHEYYDQLIRQLGADKTHVQHIQDFWGDPLTAAGAQSPDGTAAYVQLNLAGNQGQSLANESVEAVRKIVAGTRPPQGVKAFVTGPAALVADVNESGNASLVKITVVSIVVIFTMLFFVYRSVVTVVLLLVMVGIELAAARGIVAVLGHHQVIGLSTFATNLLTSLCIAAGTDYGIFLMGRYQEARLAGQDREAAYYTTYRGVAPVVLASGLTIAGAAFCLSFTRMPYLQTLAVPCAVGMLVSVAVALTMVPAVITVGGRFGLFDPKRAIRFRGWRRLGTAVVRWPAPILAAACAVALIGLLALPGYKMNYNDRLYIPKNIQGNMGYDAAERHFSQARMMPEILFVEADHDLRNPSDFLVLEKLAKAVFRVPGVSRVQAITRPEGTPIQHTSIPYMLSRQAAIQKQTMKFQQDRTDDLLVQADALAATIATMQRMIGLIGQLTDTTHHLVGETHELVALTNDVRDRVSDFEDFWRPIRSYFYYEKHCFDIPVCWSLRSAFDALDGIDELSAKFEDLTRDFDKLDAILPQLGEQFPPLIAVIEKMRTMLLTLHSTQAGLFDQAQDLSQNATSMGRDFDNAKNDDSFYLPPEVFDNPDFQRGMRLFFSSDGKAVRMIISHRRNPASLEGISRIEPIKTAAEEAVKGTPLEDAKIYLTGIASVFKDLREGSTYDLLIAGIASLCFIFIVMVVITRSFVAALVIVGTVALSLGASFGLSVLVWQHILGIELHWLVLTMAVIILLAVGSDYNLLLVSRFKEEIGAGIQTGIIRAMAVTGIVVTAAGLVFAFTMGSMVVSDLRTIGQIGSTIGLGLLFDTLIVRSFMTPSIAALLGRWFWWPTMVRPRPASTMLRPFGPRPLVRFLMLNENGQDTTTTERPGARQTSAP